MANKIYGFKALSGTGTGALGKYPEAGGPVLTTNDYAMGVVSGIFYVYIFDSTSVAAESSPQIIAPNGVAGNWLLKATMEYKKTEYVYSSVMAGNETFVEPLQQSMRVI
jgi:hypothetical protein